MVILYMRFCDTYGVKGPAIADKFGKGPTCWYCAAWWHYSTTERDAMWRHKPRRSVAWRINPFLEPMVTLSKSHTFNVEILFINHKNVVWTTGNQVTGHR